MAGACVKTRDLGTSLLFIAIFLGRDPLSRTTRRWAGPPYFNFADSICSGDSVARRWILNSRHPIFLCRAPHPATGIDGSNEMLLLETLFGG
jgi:hypothetical protein